MDEIIVLKRELEEVRTSLRTQEETCQKRISQVRGEKADVLDHIANFIQAIKS